MWKDKTHLNTKKIECYNGDALIPCMAGQVMMTNAEVEHANLMNWFQMQHFII